MNENQKQEIEKFILHYTKDNVYQKEIQKFYEEKPLSLSILQIYALEEILKYGTKAIYQNFLKTKGNYTEENAIEYFALFIKMYQEDPFFKNQKLEQFLYSPESLSEMEIMLILLFLEEKSDWESQKELLTYDDLNPICCENETEIRETLLNLLFGQAISKLLELPELKEVKSRQKEDGRIANQDKPMIIQMFYPTGSLNSNICHHIIESAEKIIEKYYHEIAHLSSLIEKEEILETLQTFNTNISIQEILGLPRKTSRKRK